MPAQDFELILRVQADLQTAVQQLRTLNDQMRVVKTGATEASTGLQALTSSARATESGVRGVSAQLKSFGSSAASVGSQLRTLAAAVASLVAIRQIASFVQSVIEANQQLGDMSQKVGVSTEALSALGSVARRNGSDLQGVQIAFVNLARAATGLNQTGVRALQAMNINLEQFKRLSPEQQFDLVAQKFAGYSDGANKAALATALLGKSGADLIPTLNEVGDQGLQRMTDRAIEAGTAVGKDAVDASVRFSNALQTLKEKLQGAVNQGLVAFTPEIEHLSDLINSDEFQQNLKDTATAVVEIGNAALLTAGKIGQAISGLQSLARYAAFLKTGVIDQDQTAQQQNNEFNALIAKREQLAAQLDTQKFWHLPTKAVEDDLNRVNGLIKAAQEAHKAAEIAAHPGGAAAGLNAATNRQKSAMDAAAGSVVDSIYGKGGGKTSAPVVAPTGGGGADAANKLAQQAAKAQDDLTQALIRLQGQLDPTAAAYAAYNATVKQANDNADLAKKAHGADAQAIDTQRDAVIALAGKIRDAALDQIAEKDRQAWEALKRSFETPAQVAVDDALKKIQQLNDLLKKGTISATEYHDAIGKVGTASVTAAPQYKGPDAVVSGAFGELQKNTKAMADLEAWHESVLAANAAFNAKDAAQEEAHQARLAQIAQTYSEQRAAIENARGMLTMQAAEEGFGQLATLMNSSNKKLAAIGRAAAIVQAGLSLAINVAKASEAGFPLNIGFIAGAIAQGAQIMDLISNAGSGGSDGYAEGGYTGAGGKYQVAGVVHAGEGVLSQRDISALGGPAGFHALRSSLRGFADGGFVNPLRNAPSPAQMGFASPAALPVGAIARAAANDSNGRAAPQPVSVKTVLVMDREQMAREILNTPTGTKLVIQHVGDNPNSIRGKWGS